MQTAHTLHRRITRTYRLNYLLFRPRGYRRRAAQRWPLILFLHGAGERGACLDRVKTHGPPKLVEQQPDFPFLVLSPQCPEHQVWDPAALLCLLDAVLAEHAVDPGRVYLTGLSMGGYATWMLGAKHPERFAAIAPICGGGALVDVLLGPHEAHDALKTLAVWAFHGARDPVVPVEESERMVRAFQSAGVAEVRLTVYPDAEHDAWTATYANPELYAWFLQHRRKSPVASEPRSRRRRRCRQ